MGAIVYGIDLAESLNYTGIVITEVTDKIRLRTLRKFNHVKYPMIHHLLQTDLFPNVRPDKLAIDYTSEKAFSEELEARMNPSFTTPGSPSFGTWRYVVPMVMSKGMNLKLKQNARLMLESKLFVWPDDPSPVKEIQDLVQQLYDQMMREVGDPRPSGMTFPKPSGQDNDLIRALEMNLMVAKEFLQDYTYPSAGPVWGTGSYDDMDYSKTPREIEVEKVLAKRGINLNNLGTKTTVKVKLHGEKEAT